MKKILVVTCSIVLAKCTFAQDTTRQKLDQMMTAYANLSRFNGSVLVAKNGNILLKKGYGRKNENDKSVNDAATIFQIASITKQFTATAVLKLVSLKKMELTDKLSKYYTGFIKGDSITIEHLLTHTAGLRNFTEEDTAINETDEQRMVPYLKSLKPDFAPGTAWHYSNSGYVMLGYIIQKVSGMSYWQAVRTLIFEPLQMKSSGFDFIHLPNDKKATGFDILSDTLTQRSAITDSTVPFAAGAIYSNVEDMYRWHLGLQGHKIIDRYLTDKAYTPSVMQSYGYGWQIDSIYGRKMLSHSGAISGFGSNFVRIPGDDICIVLLSNKNGSTSDIMQLTGKLLAVLYNKPYRIPFKRTPVVIQQELLKTYVGTYEIEVPHVIVDITIQGGVLTAQPYQEQKPGPASVMLPLDGKHFYGQDDEELEIHFDMDDTGKVKGFKVIQVGISTYAKKIK